MDLELEFLFFGFHSRVVEGTRLPALRFLGKCLEWMLLCASVVLAATLLHLHWSFVNSPGCIQDLMARENLTTSDFTVLEIHIPSWSSDFFQSIRQELTSLKESLEAEKLALAKQAFDPIFLDAEDLLLDTYLSRELVEKLRRFINEEDPMEEAEGSVAEGDVESKSGQELTQEEKELVLLVTESEAVDPVLDFQTDVIDELLNFFDFEIKFRVAEFSGFLRIPLDLHQQHNITVKSITLDPSDQCFGNSFTQALLRYFVGYETVMFNTASFVYGGRGFFYTKQTRETFNIDSTISDGLGHPLKEDDVIKNFALQLEAVINSVFLFYSVTGAVTLIFQGTQLRMLRAYMSMLQLLRSRLPVARFFIENTLHTMVNMMLLMATMLFATQFTDDPIIGFFVVFLGWCAELFTICSARTATTLRYWPKYYLFSQISFYLYHFTVPFGFSWLALALSIVFTQYAMFHFFNNCEIPAYELAQITPSRPRAIAFFGPRPGQQPQPQPQTQTQPQQGQPQARRPQAQAQQTQPQPQPQPQAQAQVQPQAQAPLQEPQRPQNPSERTPESPQPIETQTPEGDVLIDRE